MINEFSKEYVNACISYNIDDINDNHYKMTINELAYEYEQQYQHLNSKIEGLKPLLLVCTGENLNRVRKKIAIYYDMACECKRTASLLKGYESEVEE